MEIKLSTLRNFLFIALAIVGIFAVLASLPPSNSNNAAATNNVVSNPNGGQIVQVNAKGGYNPAVSEAKADIPTILRVSTKNTFDCSTALIIPRLGISRNLPPTANTDIEIPPQAAGSILNVTCSMGMYSFQVKFI